MSEFAFKELYGEYIFDRTAFRRTFVSSEKCKFSIVNYSKLETNIINKFNVQKPDTKDKIADIWYDGYGSSRHSHYNSSRCH